jgi:hypothetical protein
MHGSDFRVACDTWISGDVIALAQHAGDLWVATEGRLIRTSMKDLRGARLFEVPGPGTQAIITQTAIVDRFRNL